MVSMKDSMGTDQEDRGLVILEERALDGRNVDSLGETKASGVISEAAMTNPIVGMEYVFTPCFGRFFCAGNFQSLSTRKR